MKQTFVCDTCKKAIDLDQPDNLVLNPTRCVITKACRGTLSRTDPFTVNPDQYPKMKVDETAWVQVPMLAHHNQLVPRKVWLVKHNLNAQPMVRVFQDLETEPLDPSSYDIEYLSSSSLKLTFDTATDGIVECLVRSNTQPVVNKATTTQSTNVLITPDSILSLAIPQSTQSFVLAVYVDSPEPMVRLTYTADKVNRQAGPWRNASSVIINGRRFNIADVRLDTQSASDQPITASFAILHTDGTPFNQGEAYVLISKDPYVDLSDRIVDKCLDVAALQNKQDTVFNNSELSCGDQLLQSLYPPIIAL